MSRVVATDLACIIVAAFMLLVIPGTSARPMANIVTVEPGFDVGPGATVAWHQESMLFKLDDDLEKANFKGFFVSAVETTMVDKGYRFTGDTPSFYISVVAALSSEVDDLMIFERLGASPGLKTNRGDGYEKGTLAIVLVDPYQGQILWRSVLQGYADKDAHSDEREAAMRVVVGQMLAKLPTVPDIK